MSIFSIVVALLIFYVIIKMMPVVFELMFVILYALFPLIVFCGIVLYLIKLASGIN